MPATFTRSELVTLRRIAGHVLATSGAGAETTHEDVLQTMVVTLVQDQAGLAGRPAAYARQRAAWAARKLCRSARRYALRFPAMPVLATEDGEQVELAELVQAERANPEELAIEAEEQRQVQAWYAAVMAGEALTEAERGTVERLWANLDRPLRGPGSRAQAVRGGLSEARLSQLLGQIRAKYPRPVYA